MINIGGMRLDEYLRTREIKQDEFAQRIGVTQGRVSQIARLGIDTADIIAKIVEATNGEVAASDLRKTEAAQ